MVRARPATDTRSFPPGLVIADNLNPAEMRGDDGKEPSGQTCLWFGSGFRPLSSVSEDADAGDVIRDQPVDDPFAGPFLQ